MVSIPKIDHDWNNFYTVDRKATCTEEGSESIHCSVCGTAKEGSSRPIDKLPHNYGDWKVVKEPTCTEEGSKSKHCKNPQCDAKTEVTKIAKKAHEYSTEFTTDKEATCAEEGSKSKHCKNPNCDAKTEVTKIEKKPHDFGTTYTVDVEATCTEKGSQSIHCKHCNAKKDVTEIAAKGHDFGDWVINGTTKTHTCKRCKLVETVAVDLTISVAQSDVTVKTEQTALINLTVKGNADATCAAADPTVVQAEITGSGAARQVKLTGLKAGQTTVTLTNSATNDSVTIRVKVEAAAAQTTT